MSLREVREDLVEINNAVNEVLVRCNEELLSPAETMGELPAKVEHTRSESYKSGQADGKQTEWNDFWDVYQEKGKKVSYAYAFYHGSWSDVNFKPKYDIVPTNAQDLFTWAAITDVVGALERQGVSLDFSKCGTLLRTFSNLNKVTKLGVLDLGVANDIRYMCTGCTMLEEVEKIVFSETTGSSGTDNAFYGCSALEDAVFEGVICCNLSFQWSTKLSRASIDSIIAALSPTKTGYVTFSQAAVDKAYETSEGANNGSTSEEWLNFAVNTPWGVNLA